MKFASKQVDLNNRKLKICLLKEGWLPTETGKHVYRIESKVV